MSKKKGQRNLNKRKNSEREIQQQLTGNGGGRGKVKGIIGEENERVGDKAETWE